MGGVIHQLSTSNGDPQVVGSVGASIGDSLEGADTQQNGSFIGVVFSVRAGSSSHYNDISALRLFWAHLRHPISLSF